MPIEKVLFHTRFRDLAFNALDIIRRSPLPVMMGKYMMQYVWAGEVLTRVNDHIFDQPLLATDGSKPSENALELIKSRKIAPESP